MRHTVADNISLSIFCSYLAFLLTWISWDRVFPLLIARVSRNRPIPYYLFSFFFLPRLRSIADGIRSALIDRSNWSIRFLERNLGVSRDRFVFILQNIHYSLAAFGQRVEFLPPSNFRSPPPPSVLARVTERVALISRGFVRSPIAQFSFFFLFNIRERGGHPRFSSQRALHKYSVQRYNYYKSSIYLI